MCSFDRIHLHFEHHSIIRIREILISFWRGANPLHGEILECEKKVSQVSPDQFDLVTRKVNLNRFTFCAGRVFSGDEIAVGEKLDCAARQFDSETG